LGGFKISKYQKKMKISARAEEARHQQFSAKQRLIEQERLNRTGKRIAIFASLIIIVASIVAVSVNNQNIENNSPGYSPADTVTSSLPTDTTLKIPTSELSTTPKWYSQTSNGVNIRFMVALGSDGKYHTALDACDVCYGSKKGYRVSGDNLICNNCGRSFGINNLGTDNTAGGCWPSYLPFTVSNGNIEIEKSDLEAKRFMFA
jgi:uncharacterized membrane protein